MCFIIVNCFDLKSVCCILQVLGIPHYWEFLNVPPDSGEVSLASCLTFSLCYCYTQEYLLIDSANLCSISSHCITF